MDRRVPKTNKTSRKGAKLDYQLARIARRVAGAAAAGVLSFAGRVGAVVPQAGDYTAADVGADPAGTAAAVQTALTQTVVTTAASPYNVVYTTGYHVILVDATAGAITVNLPTAVGNTSKLDIKKIDSSANTVTVDGSGAQTVDGGATAVLQVQYESIELVSDNANWSIV